MCQFMQIMRSFIEIENIVSKLVEYIWKIIQKLTQQLKRLKATRYEPKIKQNACFYSSMPSGSLNNTTRFSFSLKWPVSPSKICGKKQIILAKLFIVLKILDWQVIVRSLSWFLFCHLLPADWQRWNIFSLLLIDSNIYTKHLYFV